MSTLQALIVTHLKPGEPAHHYVPHDNELITFFEEGTEITWIVHKVRINLQLTEVQLLVGPPHDYKVITLDDINELMRHLQVYRKIA